MSHVSIYESCLLIWVVPPYVSHVSIYESCLHTLDISKYESCLSEVSIYESYFYVSDVSIYQPCLHIWVMCQYMSHISIYESCLHIWVMSHICSDVSIVQDVSQSFNGNMTHIWKHDSHMGAWLIYLDMTHIWNCLTWNLNRSRCVRLLNTHVFFRHMSPSCQISLHIWITFFFRVRCLHICVMSHIFKHLRECENMDSWEYECIAHVASMLTSCEMQCLYMYESCHTFKRVRESRFLRIWIHRLKWNVSTRMSHATHSRECENVESWEYESVMSHVWPHRVECLHVYASCHTFKVMRGHRV